MIIDRLDGNELRALVERVFCPADHERRLAVLVDMPDGVVSDHPAWRQRRETAAAWVEALNDRDDEPGIDATLFLYRNPRRNNADLPGTAWRHKGGPLPATADDLLPGDSESLDDILGNHPLVLAPTQFSATAPLKLAARRLGFRGATMPGFQAGMIPALRLDYCEVNRRVGLLADLLDQAESARFRFTIAGGKDCDLVLDLRHRTAHRSGGLFPDPGSVGNLPSGEAYIVPYEGELPGDPSISSGMLPVDLDGEVVIYRIVANRATGVEGEGPVARRERDLLQREPAYGNMAELGLGVLGDFGIEPLGEVLLDEKLGLHIAFGRSDHFGGQVGASAFTRPEAVVHIDRVYVPSLQPRVRVALADLVMPQGRVLPLMVDGVYAVDFGT